MKQKYAAIAFVFVIFVSFSIFSFVKSNENNTKQNETNKTQHEESKPIETLLPTKEIAQTPKPEYLGNFRITAYCSCEKCCGEWAKNRPNGIVYGASGEELVAGVSCASTLPFGTVLEIEGIGTYTVQDRIASWVIEKNGENLIDIYFDDHEDACQFGLKYKDVYLKNNNLDVVK